MVEWAKTIGGDFDRIELAAQGGWLSNEMWVGFDVDRVKITRRDEEAVRNLHFALGRYLAHIDKAGVYAASIPDA